MRRSILLLVTAVAVGLLVDLGIHGGLIGVGSALAITAVAAGLLILAPDRPAERWVFTGLAVVAAGGLVWRTSPWIVVLDWCAAIGFLGLAASASPDRPLLGSSLVRLAWRFAGPSGFGPLFGPSELMSSVDAIRRRPQTDERPTGAFRRVAPAVGRGVLIAVPILLVLGLLLASADGVFASFFDFPAQDIGNPWLHLFLVGAGASVVAGLGRWATKPVDLTGTSPQPLGAVETIVVLSGLAPSTASSRSPSWSPRAVATTGSRRRPGSPTPNTPAPGSSSSSGLQRSPWRCSSASGRSPDRAARDRRWPSGSSRRSPARSRWWWSPPPSPG